MGRRVLPWVALLLTAGCGTVASMPRMIAAALPTSGEHVNRARVCGKNGVALPAGWREPRDGDAADEWRRRDPGRFLLVSGDLNGDGRGDEARLLLRNDRSAFGIFVFLCANDGTPTPHLVLHNRHLDYFRQVGIKPVGPGVYQTACGKGFMDCYPGEPREVRLAHQAIDYFKDDRVASLFYWSDERNKFRWVAIAD